MAQFPTDIPFFTPKDTSRDNLIEPTRACNGVDFNNLYDELEALAINVGNQPKFDPVVDSSNNELDVAAGLYFTGNQVNKFEGETLVGIGSGEFLVSLIPSTGSTLTIELTTVAAGFPLDSIPIGRLVSDGLVISEFEDLRVFVQHMPPIESLLPPSFPLSAPDGSAAAPSYSFASDGGTGIFVPGAGQLGFSVGGTERCRFIAETLVVEKLKSILGSNDTGIDFTTGPDLFKMLVAGIEKLRLDSTGALTDSLKGLGDSDTGITWPGSDVLNVLVAGVLKSFWDVVGLQVDGAVTWKGQSAPGLSPASRGRIYYDNTLQAFQVSENGGAYTNLLGTDTDAIHDNIAAEISAITEKTTPVGNDLLLIEDSEAGSSKKRLKISNITSGISALDADAIHDNVAAEILAITEKTVPTDNDILVIEDAASAHVKKRIKIGNLPSIGFDSDAIHQSIGAEISTLTVKSSPDGSDILVVEDSADSFSKKRISITDLLGLQGRPDNVKFNVNGIIVDADSVDGVWIPDRSGSVVSIKALVDVMPGKTVQVELQKTDNPTADLPSGGTVITTTPININVARTVFSGSIKSDGSEDFVADDVFHFDVALAGSGASPEDLSIILQVEYD